MNDGKVVFNDRSTVKNSEGAFIVMSRNMQVAVGHNAEGKEREVYKLPYGGVNCAWTRRKKGEARRPSRRVGPLYRSDSSPKSAGG